VEGQGAPEKVREQCKISEDQRIKEIKRLWIIKMDKSEYLKSSWTACPGGWRRLLQGRVPPLSTEIPETENNEK
jgi:hypothetical protein